MNTILSVEQFHVCMGINIEPDINISNPSLNRYRVKRMADELFKLNYALENDDKPGALEYLMNLQVELDSTILLLGMKGYRELAFYAVHQANMTKLNDLGNPVIMEDGRVAETKNYIGPNMHRLIQEIKISRKEPQG